MIGILLIVGYILMALSVAFVFMVVRIRQVNAKYSGKSTILLDAEKDEAKVIGTAVGALWPFTLPIMGPIFLLYHIVTALGRAAESVAKSNP